MKRFRAFILGMILLIILLPVSFAEQNDEYICEDIMKPSEWIDPGHNRIMYEIFVSSFSDSDGDGIGDLRGIINRLDYLNDGDPASGRSLGVEGLWLTPIFLSPSYHKYDVKDYYQIDPAIGTLEDLQELIRLCHERGMIVILDLPINHTSGEHKWYINFVNSHLLNNAGNQYYDYYTWLPKTADAPAGRHFMTQNNGKLRVEANFSDSMPELNFDNPEVREAVVDIAAFYLGLGIDGFRFDAAKYIYYGDHSANADFWTWYIDRLKEIKPDLYTIAEVWDSDSVTERYVPALNCFNFTCAQAEGLIAKTAAAGNVNKMTAYVENYISTIRALNPDAANCFFISNHDTDRAAGYLTVASGRMQMAANLYLLSPGSPFIYYGEEIGLRGSRGGANTDANRRLAMLWGDGDTVSDPIGTTYDPAKQSPYTVLHCLQNETSLYNHYKKLIMIRKANPEIASGEYHALQFKEGKAGGFTSTLNGQTICVLHNTTTRAITLDLSSATALTFDTIAAVIGGTAELTGTTVTIDGQTSVVLR